MRVARYTATLVLLFVHFVPLHSHRDVTKLHSHLLTTAGNMSGCPVVREVEADYKYVKAVAQIVKNIGRPYVITGGSSMGLLRFGAVSIQPDPKSDRRFANDNDLDFFVYSRNDSDREAFCTEAAKQCKEAKIFDGCGCGMVWRNEGTSMIVPGKEDAKPDAAFFDLRDFNETHMVVQNWPNNFEREGLTPWKIDRSVLFPARKAKYYDQEFDIAHQPVEFLSNAVPVYRNQPVPEYGSGCLGMAYPSWLVSDAKWGGGDEWERKVTGLSISLDVLEQCSRALDEEGFASFYSDCFSDEATKQALTHRATK